MQINGKSALKHDHSGFQGFTLIESAIVLVVIGTVMTVGAISWMSIKSGFEISHTRAKLRAVKSCLMERMILSERYPDFTLNLQENEDDNYQCVNNVPTKAVDYCLCKAGYKDAWGRRIRFLGGIDEDGDSINGTEIIDGGTFDKTNFPGENSNATDKDGRVVTNIAFILLSKGKNGEFDRSTTRSLFHSKNTLVGSLKDGTPDFEFDHKDYDDQVLILTGYGLSELLP
jgi:prepilin-type N-terminal cleavage/methylation domain-containing protein